MTATDPGLWPYAAIFVMAAATALVRLTGYWVMGAVPLTRRVRRMLDALPGSVIVATIAPIVLNNGLSAMLGVTVVAAMMLLRRNELLAVFVGLAVVALVRAGGL